MIRVGNDSGRPLFGSVISVNIYMSVIKIGRSSGSILRVSFVNRFGRNFSSDNVDSLNLKKKHIFGSVNFRFRFEFSDRVTFEQLYIYIYICECNPFSLIDPIFLEKDNLLYLRIPRYYIPDFFFKVTTLKLFLVFVSVNKIII